MVFNTTLKPYREPMYRWFLMAFMFAFLFAFTALPAAAEQPWPYHYGHSGYGYGEYPREHRDSERERAMERAGRERHERWCWYHPGVCR